MELMEDIFPKLTGDFDIRKLNCCRKKKSIRSLKLNCMENITRILKVLEKIHSANSRIEGKRLEQLININLLNIENDEPLWGGELLRLLNEMKEMKLIFQDEDKKYSITKQGLDHLESATK
jgi:hypothetical protein